MILLRKIWGNLSSSETQVLDYVAVTVPILAICSFLDGIQSVLSGIDVNFIRNSFVCISSILFSAFMMQVKIFAVITIKTSWEKEVGHLFHIIFLYK